MCYDVARKRQREFEMPAEMGSRERCPTLRVALQTALKRLNPKHRMVFLLFEVEGLRHADIASILEIPEGTSKGWLFEAKKELKRLLTEAGQ